MATERPAGSATTRRAVLVAAVLGTALAYMSDDMLNLAIPSVARDLQATVTDAQWILNAYYVSLLSCVLVAGSLGDVAGHRRVFLAAIFLFSAGGVGCAVAPSIGLLVAGRFVQGAGAAMLLTAGLALVSRLNPPEDRGRAVGQFLGLVAAVPALGPLLSGALVDWLSWRWLFVVPLVLPAAALVVTRRLVPETPLARGRRLSPSGAVLAFLVLGALSVALITGAVDSSAPVPAVAAVAAALSAVGFARHQRRTPDPLIPLRVLGRRVFLGGNLVWLLGCMTSWGAVFFLAVTLQATLGRTPVTAGLLLTPIYLVMMIGSPMIGKVVDRIGPRRPLLGGLALYTAGLLLIGRIGAGSSLAAEVVVPVLVMAAGMATFTTPLATVTMGALDEADQGVASAFNNAMGQLAGLLAVLVLPAAAGLGGVAFGDPRFAAGFSRSLLVVAGIASACIPLAAWTLAGKPADRVVAGPPEMAAVAARKRGGS